MLLSTTKVGFVLTLSYYESRIKTLCEGLASANTAPALHAAFQDGGDDVAGCACVITRDGIAHSVCVARRGQWAHLSRESVTGGARVAECLAAGQSPTANVP